jgi:hypothetical protein
MNAIDAADIDAADSAQVTREDFFLCALDGEENVFVGTATGRIYIYCTNTCRFQLVFDDLCKRCIWWMQYDKSGSFLTVYLIDDVGQWASCKMVLRQNSLGAYLEVVPDIDGEYLNEIPPEYVSVYAVFIGPRSMQDVCHSVQEYGLVLPADLSLEPDAQQTRSWIIRSPTNPLTVWIAAHKNEHPCIWVWSSEADQPTEVYQTYPLDPNDFVVGVFVINYSVSVVLLNEIKTFELYSKRRKVELKSTNFVAI